MTAAVVDLRLERAIALVHHSVIESRLRLALVRLLFVLMEIYEFAMDGQHLIAAQAVRLPVDEGFNRCQLLQDEDVLVLLTQVYVSQV